MEYRSTNETEQKIYSECEVPVSAGTYSGCVRVIGSGHTMWDDWKRSEELMPGTDTIGINFAGMVHPNLTHLFSWHPKQISAIKAWRMAEWPDDKSIVHSVNHHKTNCCSRIDQVWNFNGATSVSGMTACELAWLLGYRRIALVGVPQDSGGYFYKPQDNKDMYDKFRKREAFKLNELINGCVRSFSGYTKQVLGEPDEEWLCQGR
jgi:hypothetical protein